MGASLEAGVIENRGTEKTSRVGFRDFRSQGAVLIHEERISNVSHALVMLVHIVFIIIFLRSSKISSGPDEISPFPDCVGVSELAVGWTMEPSSALTSVNIIRNFLSETNFF